MRTFRKILASLTPPIILIAVMLSLLGGAITATPARAATFTVTKTADTNDGTCNADCSLREAIGAANASGGADIINIPPGTYQLTIANGGGLNEDSNATGDLDILDSVTLQGSGSGVTIIQAGTDNTNGIDKVIAVNPICTSVVNATIDGVTIRYGRNSQPITAPDFSYSGGGIDYCAGGGGGTFTLSNSVVSDNTNVNAYGGGLNTDAYLTPSYTLNITNVTFQNNRTLVHPNTGTGGAINIWGDQITATITGSTFTGNTTGNATSAGGAIYFRPSAITVGPTSSLTISNSLFSSNVAAGSGGAIGTATWGAGTTVSISNSQFTNNTATNSFGGAIYLDSTTLNTTPFALTHLIITGNTAGNAGGGLFIGKSNVNMSKSFIVGNTATLTPTSNGLRKSVDAATATIENNWWGCSTGPSAGPCDTASTAGGTLDFTPWYRNQLTATTSPIKTNQSTSLTASFLTNSAGSAVPLADISEIIGKSVAWAATNGNLSSTQATVQAAGTAIGSFQATAAGTAIISAKVSNDNTAPVSSNVLSLTVNKANTTAAIISDTPDPSVTGQPVTVTYTVTGEYGNSPTAPTGNVTVTDGVDSCTGTVAAGSCNITFRTAGAKTITATYAGDANFNASPASASASHTVNKADTTSLIVSMSPEPSVTGGMVTFNVSVSANSPGAAVAPTTITGSVTVSDGGSNSCIVTLTAGAGSCTIAFPAVGTYTMTGVYGGDSNFNGSTSSNMIHQVNKADTTTTISSDLPDPSVFGETVTVNFGVTVNAPGAGTPTGNVTVSDGVDSCTALVATGTCNITFTTTGAKSLTATYAGDANFNGSASSPATSHTVNKADTTTSLTSDLPDPSVVGESVTVNFSVAVTAPGSGTPTGNVTVSDGVDSCTALVAAGTCNIIFTSIGSKSLTATYAGDSKFNGSASSPVTSHTVNKADTTTSITSDLPDPSVVGETVTVNFSVAVTAPGGGTPGGNVTVTDGVDSCVGTAASGTCNITFTSPGAKSLTATYAGDSNYNGSASSPATSHQVSKADTTTTITSDLPDPSVFGQTVTINFTVVATAPGAGTPAGNVTVSDGVDSCTALVATGTCNITFTSAGAKSLTATYVGDSNFNGSASSPVTSHTVDKADTTTSITSDAPDSSIVGAVVTVNFSVSVTAPGAGTPGGNVTVSDGVDSCIGTAASGTCNITLTTIGNRTLTATYAGDSNFNGSASAGESHVVDGYPTTTSITSDLPDPSVVGQTVTVQYSVTTGTGTPIGNVTVSDGVDSCIGTVAAGQCVITFTSVGLKSLTATYAGDSTHTGSVSGTESHQVNKADTTTTITSDSPDSSELSQTVTVNFTVVAAAPGGGTPTGNVTVTDGVDSCVGTVVAGTCNLALTTLGNRTLTATYTGDSNYNGDVSPGESHTVVKHATTTTITSDSPDASVTGQTVTIQFTVTTGTGTATGNVTVSDGTDSCVATVILGQCNITFTTAGPRTLTATYAGDATHAGSVSANEPHAVNKADTTTSITSDAPDASYAATVVTVNFSVSVTAPGVGTPTGNVTVSDGVDSCVGTVASGTCDITLTTIGNRTLTATYAGDSDFNGSASAGEPHTVDGYATTTAITSDLPDPSVTGESVTVQFTVTTGTGTPTGNVTVSDGTDSCVGTVAAGQCAITFTSAGIKTITATYAGDLTHVGSVSPGAGHQVNKADTTTSITSDSPDPSSAVQSVTVNFTVVANAPGSGTPTGNVTVSDGVDSCVGTVAAGTCNLTLTTGGARTLTATYAGDSNFNGSVSSGVSHFVDNVAPGVTINKASGQADPTSAATINFTVTFTEAVSDFNDASDVDLSASTAGGALSAVISGGPTIYNVAVTGMTSSGDVIASIPASSVVDGVGNPNTGSTSSDNAVAWVLDTTAPDTTIDSMPSNPVASTSASFTFSGTDNFSASANLTFECQMDSGGFASCSSPALYTGLALGFHTIDVRAIDEAGNPDASPATYTWEVIEGPIAVLSDGFCISPPSPSAARANFEFINPLATPLTLSLASNSNPTLVKNSSVTISVTGSTGTITVKTNFGKTGTAVLTFNLSDGTNTTQFVINVQVGTAGHDTLNGTTGMDMIFGMSGNDIINGGDGSDVLCGSNGNDTLNGGNGDDVLDGGAGNDALNGNNNNDILYGRNGIDTMTGGLGADFFSGGLGIDILTDFNVPDGDTKDGTSP